MENKNHFTPVSKEKRIEVLDALRGFAIFGILIINISVFSGYAYLTADEKNVLMFSEWNSVFDDIHTIFFSGKFYALFSLLFGIGFAIQLIRAEESKRSFLPFFSRRLFILLLIGIVHLWGIWFSDILVLYAFCGYILIAFKNFSRKMLLISAFIIMLIPALHSWYLQKPEVSYTDKIYEKLNEKWKSADLPEAEDEYETFQMRDVTEVIQTDSWTTVLSFNYIGPLLRGYIIMLDARVFKVLAIFILGLWTGRKLLSEKIHENKSFLFPLAAAGFVIGIPLNIIYASESWSPFTKEAISPFAYISLTAGYASSFTILYQTGLNKIFSSLFGAVGKTALSNYIFQSVICIFIFYEAGLGLGKYTGSAILTLSVIIIFILQLILSKLWMKKFKYGPLEWVWRVLTYGKHIRNKI